MTSTAVSEETMSVNVFDSQLDPITEMQLRTWARKNYCSPNERETDWHPVIHDEMTRRDLEIAIG